MRGKLTTKRRIFVESYLTCWNATEAARRAGYAHPNKQGPRLLVDVGVKASIEARIRELKMDADEVLTRLAQQARGEHAAYIQADGSVDLKGMIADGKQHLIKGTRPTREGLVVEFYDGQAALALLGKAHRLFVDRIEQDMNGTLRVEYVNDWRANQAADAASGPDSDPE